VKLKTLAVITLVVLGCSFASAQSFWNAAGTYEYCNFFVAIYNSGGVAAGYDDLTTVCGYGYNSPIVGFVATTANDGQPAHGKGVVVGDAIYDAEDGAFSGDQWAVWLSDKTSKKTKTGHFTGPYGWVGVAGSYTGTYFGDNYGYTSAGFPEEGTGHGTYAGQPPEKPRK
jgi:hypothetical protein